MTTVSWATWRRHFESNARRPMPPPAELPELPEAWRAAITRSLARFQVGEAGEGRIAHQIDRHALRGVDADYRASLKLFVREEGRHARILAGLVRGLGGELLRAHWTERLFVRGRRLAGVRLKLLALLAAEVVGIEFYDLLARRLPAGELRARLEEIRADEAMHLEFHADFFRVHLRGPAPRACFLVGWWAVAGVAATLVVIDHGPSLRALELSRVELLRGL
ncbi:MAG: hypothetical protein KC468_28055, partial [Myxococcales bacterium]|nr:hypothetical protein [Myxococcales bacterium]